jgi:HSP20 family protein
MALIHWEPVAELNTIQSEMNRLFNTFVDQSGQSRRTDTARPWIPAMDLLEGRDDYVLRADLPGLSDADVSVQLEDNVLTISGERKPEHDQQPEGYYRLERAVGAFSRSLSLPDGVDPNGVQAHFDRGVLEIRIPKPAQKKPRSVSIALGHTDKAIEGTETADATVGGGQPRDGDGG